MTFTSRALKHVVILVAFVGLLATARPVAAADLCGCWSGCWESCCTGHHGPLKATFCKIDDQHYCVHFRGRFWVIVPFRYSVMLTVTKQQGDKIFLEGESYLGRLIGTFRYQAEATPCEFKARYISCKDEGRFDLTRRCP